MSRLQKQVSNWKAGLMLNLYKSKIQLIWHNIMVRIKRKYSIVENKTYLLFAGPINSEVSVSRRSDDDSWDWAIT